MTNLVATGTDESGQASGTLIGTYFPSWTQNGLTAPYGSLVGEINNVFFYLGTNFNLNAPATGTLSLYYWDSDSYNNSQFVTVSIENSVSTVPTPTTFWLFGSGLMGLIGLQKANKWAA
ncbi:hypothetical protein [methane-oxidizing endosymbiont of Gigantopelta aegis]|uniref:hypothetical protein n=1 Tax=methane-oxidizing endosymbiont of Gigantopelta aegis TaxID=2794938 RepID=UPI0018DB1B99|nr:hypothetical protein [methane-oxidizing endosymbiont of Gigantopelta aegis]